MELFTKENLQKYLTPEGLDRAILISSLQDILMALEKSNLELICNNLIKSKFLRDIELVKRLVDNIFICCKYREFYVDQYAFLFYFLYQIMQNASKIEISVNTGFVKKENINLSLFTFQNLTQKNQTCQNFLKKGINSNLNLNVHVTSRRKSLILSENRGQKGTQSNLNEEENQIVSIINDESENDSAQFENEEKELFIENFVMKSSSILKAFKERIFTITLSISKQPWRLYCIYKCLQIFNDNSLYEYLKIFFNDSPTVEIEHMTVFAFFAPVLKAHFPDLYEKLYNEMNNKNRFSHLPHSFNEFFSNFKENDRNGWNSHDQTMENCGFQIGTPQYAIRHDDVTFFINQKEKKDELFNVNMRVKTDVYIRYPMLKSKCTLLQLAAYYGSEKCFAFLIENGADPDIEDDVGLRVMHYAVVGGSHSIIVSIQKLGYTFDIGSVALVAECYRLSLFQWILSVLPINLEESYLQTGTILHRAASGNNILILLFCISNGVNVNVFDNLNLTPLFYAASNCSIDVINALLAHKDIDWSLADKFKDTPLHGAAKSNDCDTFVALLKHKDADINVRDFRNRSAFKYAVGEGKYDVAKMLINDYSDVLDFNEVDDLGNTLSFVSPFSGFLNTFILICNCPKIDLNVHRNDGYYLIHVIVLANRLEFVRAFLNQERADPNPKLPDGSTALHIAARKGLAEITRLLIENDKTLVNVKNKAGMTPIHVAIRHLNTDVVRILVESGKIDEKMTVVFIFYCTHDGVFFIFFLVNSI